VRVVFDGLLYRGAAATREPAVVTVTATGLRIEAGGTAEWWRYEEFRQTQGAHRGEPVRFEREGGGEAPAVVVDDPAILAAIAALGAGPAARRFRPRRSLARVAMAAVAGALAAGAALYLWIIPALAAVVARRVPVAWEEEVGRRTTDLLAPPGSRCDDAEVGAALEAMLARLQRAQPGSPYTYRVAVARHAAINAFAAPGGYVVVFSGLLEQADRPELVAGVLAHELQHVEQRHGTQAILRAIPLQLVIAAVAGDVSGLAGFAEMAGRLGSLRYQRGDEAAADRAALETLRAARIEPRGLVDFFRALEAKAADVPEQLAYLSTHPRTADRIARLESALDSLALTPEPLMSEQRWRALATRCSG
jgi:predicted Zn-dependent protease